MSEGFSAFKAMALGLGAVMMVTVVAPDIASGQFDTFRLNKGKGKGSGGSTTSPSPTSIRPFNSAPGSNLILSTGVLKKKC